MSIGRALVRSHNREPVRRDTCLPSVWILTVRHKGMYYSAALQTRTLFSVWIRCAVDYPRCIHRISYSQLVGSVGEGTFI